MNPTNPNKFRFFLIFGLTLLIFTLISVGVTLFSSKAPDDIGKNVKIEFQKLELMLTLEDQEQGLQNRTELCDKCGMLFVFEKPQILGFWMKNTFVPIDIIYLDKDNIVVNRIVKPELNNTQKLYSSLKEAKYALEIPSKRADELNIKVGDKLLFDY